MDDLVRIYASGDAFAAELMKGRLEAEGISVLDKGAVDATAYPTGASYLWVRAEDETTGEGDRRRGGVGSVRRHRRRRAGRRRAGRAGVVSA